MLLKKLPLVFLVLTGSLCAHGQDTSLIQRHHFDRPVRNVFRSEKDIYVKTGRGVYQLEDGKWKLLKLGFTKPFVFYENGFFEADYLPNKYIFDASVMADLVPQHALSAATKAETEGGFFLAIAGALYEYEVNKNYQSDYRQMSIRDIYFDKSLKIVSTYSGIFINDSLRASTPQHSNGPVCKVGNSYFLCADQLYKFQQPDSFILIESGENNFAGYSRKIIEFRGKVYSLNTKSVNVFDRNMNMDPIHQGFEYYDMEVVQGKLLFSTKTGEVFMYDGHHTTQLIQLNSRIRDIYAELNQVYLSSDKGVYIIKNLNPATLQLVKNTEHAVMVLVDRFRNTWISTENGMFVKPDKSDELITFIPDVEFNRGALTYNNDRIYAGSVSGMYIIDIYHAMKNVIPVRLASIQKRENDTRKSAILFSAIVLSLAITAWFGFRRYKVKAQTLNIPHKTTQPKLNLENLENIIRTNQIVSVEGLADYFHTSTVQLNREFKVFDTTPGKFLREVKLKYARELIAEKKPMAEVVRVTGYSASFLHKFFKIDQPKSV